MDHRPICENVKLLEENIGVNLFDLELGNGFLYMTPKQKLQEKKIDKQDFIKI